MSRDLDLICVGRSSVDLYGEQIGTRLEDVASFARYVGGCPANVAIGAARLGLKSGLITRVGDEQLGRFIVETLKAEGVDTDSISVDRDRLTALVILAVRDQQTFPHIFYRTDCADMALRPVHIVPGYVERARAVLLTGTHLSTPGVLSASEAVLTRARAAGVRIVLDIDYRPALWGRAAHANGDRRFVADATASERIHTILPHCALVVGTEDEICVAAGVTTLTEALRVVRASTDAVVVVKRGAEGCVVIVGPVPDPIDDGMICPGYPVRVLNTLGAGDGFLAGLLRGWLRGEDWMTCCRYGNAAGALVASRHGCSPATPSWTELQEFMDGRARETDTDSLATVERLHRVTTRRPRSPEVWALAFDHRTQFEELADRAGVARERIGDFKSLIAAAASSVVDGHAPRAALIDDQYGGRALSRLTGQGWWLARPVEVPASRPLQFTFGNYAAAVMRKWAPEHIAKCLVHAHPDDTAELRAQQESRLASLTKACHSSGREVLVEIVPPASLGRDAATLARILNQFYDRGIEPDWWKLPPPLCKEEWDRIATTVRARDRWCRGIVLLGQSAPDDELGRAFELVADDDLCCGFAIGRGIFQQSAEQWFAGRIDDVAARDAIANAYRRIIELWVTKGSHTRRAS